MAATIKRIPFALLGLALVLVQMNSISCARLNTGNHNKLVNVDSDLAHMDVIDVQDIDCSDLNVAEDERCNYKSGGGGEDGGELSSADSLRYAKFLGAYLDLLENGGVMGKQRMMRVRETANGGGKKTIQKKLEKQKTLKDFFALRF